METQVKVTSDRDFNLSSLYAKEKKFWLKMNFGFTFLHIELWIVKKKNKEKRRL